MIKQNKIYLLIIFLFVVSILIFLLTFKINMIGNVVLQEKEIPIDLTIGEKAAFNLTKGFFNFGRIPYGSSSARKLNITNDYSFPILVEFEIQGDENISDFFLFNKTITLEPGEIKKVEINTINFNDEPFGTYSGKLIVRIKRYIG
ncbi:MAG: hypothetical protein KKF48_02455 [Nanoarchaeota archaeon]|nr:hypothetical protein [Nanoarchaeota archaeon]MBU1027882.1 hypothetical protein [Nanoarchaeota archaeon]